MSRCVASEARVDHCFRWLQGHNFLPCSNLDQSLILVVIRHEVYGGHLDVSWHTTIDSFGDDGTNKGLYCRDMVGIPAKMYKLWANYLIFLWHMRPPDKQVICWRKKPLYIKQIPSPDKTSQSSLTRDVISWLKHLLREQLLAPPSSWQ